MAEVIAFCNSKGGVAKTSSSNAWATSLAKRGYKVLFIDLDENGDSTFILRGTNTNNIYEVLMGRIPIQQGIQPVEHFDLIPAHEDLSDFDMEAQGSGKLLRLKTALSQLDPEAYDYIICDLPPNLEMVTLNALIAADTVIIPAQAEVLSVKRIAKMAPTLQQIKNGINPDLKIEGILLTRYDNRTTISRLVREQAKQIAEMIDTKIFDQWIRENVAVKNAQGSRMQLLDYNQRAGAAQDYEKVIDQFLKERGKKNV